MNGADLTSFDFSRGRRLAGKYEILEQLGSGWEGQVYRVRVRWSYVTRR